MRLFSIFILSLPTIFASYCGKYGVPYSFEVLSSGAPVLGCAQPSCVIQPSEFQEDSEFLTDAKGQVDGYFREGDRETKRYRHESAPKFVANCSGGFEHLACSNKNQWVGGIEYIDHPRQPLVLQCCSYEGLKFSQEVGMTTIGAGEAITGGEVVRNGRQISFDVIANVKKIVNAGKINYEVTVRRMNCLPDPPEPEVSFDDDVPSEIVKVLGTAKNGKDLGTAQKFEKKQKLTDKPKKGKKHRKVPPTQSGAPQQPVQPLPTQDKDTNQAPVQPQPAQRQLPNPPAQEQPQVPVEQPQVPYNTQQVPQQPIQPVQQPSQPIPGPPQPQPIQSGQQPLQQVPIQQIPEQNQGFPQGSIPVQQGVPNSQQGPASSSFGCQEGSIQQAVFQQPNQPCYGVANQQYGPTQAPPAAVTPATILLTFPTLPPHSFPPHTFPTLPPHTFPPGFGAPGASGLGAGGVPTIPPFTFPPGPLTIPSLPPHTFPPGGIPTLPPHTFPPGIPTLPPHTFPPGGFPTLPPHTFAPGFPTLPPHTFPPFPGFGGLGVTPVPSFGGAAPGFGGASAFGVPSVPVGTSGVSGTSGSGAAAFGAPSVSGGSAPLAPIPAVPGASSGSGSPFDIFGAALSPLLPSGATLPTLPTLPTLAPELFGLPTTQPPPQPLPIAQASGSQAQAQSNNPGAPVNMELPALSPHPDLSVLEQQLRSQGQVGPAQTAGGVGPAVNGAPTYQGQAGPNPNECSDSSPTTTTQSSDCNNNQVIPDTSGVLPTVEELHQRQAQQAYPQQAQVQQQVPYYTQNNGGK